jgi:hypothetical protein
MTTFNLRHGLVPDWQQQANNEDLLTGINFLGQFFSTGAGAPTHTPDGPQFYLRNDGGAGTTLYVWEPGASAWDAK